MKNKRTNNRKRLIILAVFIFVIAAVSAVTGGLGFRTAHVIKTEKGTDMVLMDNSPVIIRDETPYKSAFEKYSTGDKILLICGPIAETLPAGATMHWCVKLGGGDFTAIPEDILKMLYKMGYRVIGDILLSDEKAAPVLQEYHKEIEFIENRHGIEITVIDDITIDIIKTEAALQHDNKNYRFGEMMAAFAQAISGGEAI